MESHLKNSFSTEEIAHISGTTFYVSGGTGFTGRWIISALRSLFEKKNRPEIKIISRSPLRALELFKDYSNFSVTSWEKLNYSVSPNTQKSKVVGFHASVPAASGVNIHQGEVEYFKANTESYARLLSNQYLFPAFINLSSGTVYKRPTSGLIPEANPLNKPTYISPYDQVKFADEKIVENMTAANLINGANPRLFSFTGPGIEVPGKFALGSFMNDALSGKAVRITGSGDSTRSYMSPVDMAIWLLKTAIYPTIETIHIGSSEGLSMSKIATIVSRKFGTGEIEFVSGSMIAPESYVPENVVTKMILHVDGILSFISSLESWANEIAKRSS